MPGYIIPEPFLSAPDELSAAQVLQRLTEMAEAAVAEKESSSSNARGQDSFCRVLHLVFDFIDEAAPQPASLGITWLTESRNRVLFRQIVANEDSLAFFRVHLSNRFIVGMLEDHGVLSLIPEGHRTEFVSAVLGRWIPGNDNWISVALASQIDANALTSAVTCWLRHPEDFEGGDTFAARFLRTGPGSSHKAFHGHWVLPFGCSRLWHLFTTEQEIRDALNICAELVPSVFFEAPAKENDIPVSRKVRLRLGVELAGDVLQLAISNLRSRDGLSAIGFDCLSTPHKRSVIRRTDICPLPFLVKFAMDNISGDGPGMFNAYVGQITPLCTNYAADLAESFAYIREAKKNTNAAPYIPGLIGRIEQTLKRNAAMHRVDPSMLELD